MTTIDEEAEPGPSQSKLEKFHGPSFYKLFIPVPFHLTCLGMGFFSARPKAWHFISQVLGISWGGSSSEI
jgi:hypothetical protein